jgi:hypothetical protein
MGAMAMDFAALSRVPQLQLPPARADRSGLVKDVWLLLYTQGGLWSVTELRGKLKLDRELRTALAEMVERGQIMRRKVADIDGRETVQYSVTRKCKVPRGVVIEEIEELLQMAAGGRAQ